MSLCKASSRVLKSSSAVRGQRPHEVPCLPSADDRQESLRYTAGHALDSHEVAQDR